MPTNSYGSLRKYLSCGKIFFKRAPLVLVLSVFILGCRQVLILPWVLVIQNAFVVVKIIEKQKKYESVINNKLYLLKMK
jgi:hypothetical protein